MYMWGMQINNLTLKKNFCVSYWYSFLTGEGFSFEVNQKFLSRFSLYSFCHSIFFKYICLVITCFMLWSVSIVIILHVALCMSDQQLTYIVKLCVMVLLGYL
jgi:hypothetical protein